MKLIGKQSDNVYIVTVTSQDLANILGVGWSSSEIVHADKRFEVQRLPVGTDININDLYKRAQEATGAYTTLKTNIESIKKQLTRLQNLMNGEPLLTDGKE